MSTGDDTLTIDKNFAPSTLTFGNAITDYSGQDTVTINSGVTVTGAVCLGNSIGSGTGCNSNSPTLE